MRSDGVLCNRCCDLLSRRCSRHDPFGRFAYCERCKLVWHDGLRTERQAPAGYVWADEGMEATKGGAHEEEIRQKEDVGEIASGR